MGIKLYPEWKKYELNLKMFTTNLVPGHGVCIHMFYNPTYESEIYIPNIYI